MLNRIPGRPFRPRGGLALPARPPDLRRHESPLRQLLVSPHLAPGRILVRRPGLELLTYGVVSSASQLDIDLTSYTRYRAIKFLLSSFVPVTDDVELWMRFSTDGGQNFDATGYSFALQGFGDAGAAVNKSGNAVNQITIAGGASANEAVSNVANEGGADVEVTLHNQTTSRFSRVGMHCRFFSAGTVTTSMHGAGTRETAQDTDAVRFLFESNQIASGDWAAYGCN